MIECAWYDSEAMILQFITEIDISYRE
jgi:hypothetical protein